MQAKDEKRFLVVGIGNEAMQDDGLGVRLVTELRGRGMPEGISLSVLRSDPLDFLLLEDEADVVVFVDAVRSGAPPGTVHRLDVEEVLPSAPGRMPSSLHHVGLRETLQLARAMGRDFRAVVLGVECDAIGPGRELTERLSAMLPDVVEAVAAEIMNIYTTISVSPTMVR